MTLSHEDSQLYSGLARVLLVSPEDDLEGQREYVRLFLSPNGAVCPPWQSVYMAAEGELPRLMGTPHHSALQWYRRFGFEPSLESEPADHAGLLLLFYAHLIESGAPPEDLEAFSREHLSWLGAFGGKLQGEARLELYQEAGATLQSLFATS
jgi:TorA maturation chaperone TorD